MSDQVRIGVVGVGHMGSIHARVLASTPGAKLVGVHDADPRRAREVAGRYGCKAFESLEALLSQVDAVVCATPTSTHHRIGLAVLRSGRHLLMEKPLAETTQEARELVEVAEREGLLLAVGYVERFNPALLAVKGHINRPAYMVAERLSPFLGRGTDVDVITDLMVHDLDLAIEYLGEPCRVEAVGVPVLTEKIDIANARLEFPSGAIASLTASRVSLQKTRKLRLFQRDRYISVDLLKGEVMMVVREEGAVLPYFPEVDKAKEPIALQDATFVRAILGEGRMPVDGKRALGVMELAQKILEDAAKRLSKLGLHPKAPPTTPSSRDTTPPCS